MCSKVLLPSAPTLWSAVPSVNVQVFSMPTSVLEHSPQIGYPPPCDSSRFNKQRQVWVAGIWCVGVVTLLCNCIIVLLPVAWSFGWVRGLIFCQIQHGAPLSGGSNGAPVTLCLTWHLVQFTATTTLSDATETHHLLLLWTRIFKCSRIVSQSLPPTLHRET